MTDDLVQRLREYAEQYGVSHVPNICDAAADRIETLESALIRIWSYPTNVSNPRQQINEMKDFAFKVIKEGNEDAKPD